FRKSVGHVFGPERAQMNDRPAGDKLIEETKHEIDGVVGGKDAEIAGAGPHRIERREWEALLQIIFVRHHAAFRAATRSGGVDDAGRVLALARDKNRLARAAKFFPALRAGEVDVCGSFGN